MWIGKKGAAAAPPPQKAAVTKAPQASKGPSTSTPTRELHVPHQVEAEITTLLIQRGRLEMKVGKHLLHFSGITRNHDGSVDYLVRTRMHTHNGMQRNFESQVRIFHDRPPSLIR